jgi:hypothetical protein
VTSPDRAPAPIPALRAESAAPAPVLVDGVDVDALAAAVRACPAVADLSGGLLGSAGTYLPGRRVPGIVIRSVDGVTEVDVRVVARYGPTMATVADQVHSVAAATAPATAISVFIDDIDDAAVPPAR